MIKRFEKEVQEEREYYQILESLRKNVEIEAAISHNDALNTKAAALLTHVSIMIAALSILVALFTLGKRVTIVDFLIFGELIIYVVIALLCLRTIPMASPDYARKMGPDIEGGAILIARRRRQYYNFCLKVTALATLIFVVLLCFKLVDYIMNSAAKLQSVLSL